MKKFSWVLFLGALIGLSAKAQSTPPKLVVGIVVDQMVYDYLYRYEARFGKKGFRLLMEKGMNCRNTQYNFVPTYTGPGHASIYTGATPKDHGIVGNAWYDRNTREMQNCVTDTNEQTIGSSSSNGVRSPKTLKCMTITDQLKWTYPNSKVISVSFKDRGAILPGGHLSDGSYWFDFEEGKFVSSTFFKDQLPNWVNDFNGHQYPQEYLNKTWETLYPLSTYTASGPDDSPYEVILKGKSDPVFPYDLKAMTGGVPNFELFAGTPFANTYLTDFALASLENEGLGEDQVPDMLCISYSTPDIVGHAFGPQSVEIEDLYLRLDQELERLFATLRKKVGKDFVVFLTADHAVVPVPQMLMDNDLPGGYLFYGEHLKRLRISVSAKFGKDYISEFTNNNIYLDLVALKEDVIDLALVEKYIANEMLEWPGVKETYTSADLNALNISDHYAQKLKNGFDKYRSGNVLIQTLPGYLSKSKDNSKARKGTSHGSAYAYDTHVPLLWYGANIPKGETFDKAEITDIVPTLTHILNLQYPNCAIGNPILDVLQK